MIRVGKSDSLRPVLCSTKTVEWMGGEWDLIQASRTRVRTFQLSELWDKEGVRLSVRAATVEEIWPWRDLYRHEMNCQIVGDSIDERPGWTQPYLLYAGEETAGYASIAVSGPWKGKPTVFQFFVLPQFRGRVFDFFTTLVAEVKPVGMEAFLQAVRSLLRPTCTDRTARP